MNRVEQLQIELDRARRDADRETLTAVCQAAGIGVSDVLGKGRSRHVAKARAAVAWSLHRKLGWRQKRVAEALGVSLSAVEKMAVTTGKHPQ